MGDFLISNTFFRKKQTNKHLNKQSEIGLEEVQTYF